MTQYKTFVFYKQENPREYHHYAVFISPFGEPVGDGDTKEIAVSVLALTGGAPYQSKSEVVKSTIKDAWKTIEYKLKSTHKGYEMQASNAHP